MWFERHRQHPQPSSCIKIPVIIPFLQEGAPGGIKDGETSGLRPEPHQGLCPWTPDRLFTSDLGIFNALGSAQLGLLCRTSSLVEWSVSPSLRALIRTQKAEFKAPY